MATSAQQTDGVATPSTSTRTANRWRPRPPQAGGGSLAGPSDEQSQIVSNERSGQRSQRQRRPPRGLQNPDGASDVATPSSNRSMGGSNATQDVESGHQPRRRPPRQRSQRPQVDKADATGPEDSTKPREPSKRSGRAPRFNAGLSEDKPESTSSSRTQQNRGASKRDYVLAKKPDLTSTLTYDLSTPPYPDCLICFSAIRPFEPTFSCSPNIPIAVASSASDDESKSQTAATAQCCWTTFHLKCIKSWASKSVKDTEAAWRARGEEREGVWRCPGCQAKRSVVPSAYRCFCGSVIDPRPPRLATPHSCASACTRKRTCGHACPLPCHPGPCPLCQVTTQMACFCGKKVLSFRCGSLSQSRAMLSCAQTCDRLLGCGNHRCQLPCHDGPCTPCLVREKARCYCGKEERDLACGEGEDKVCVVLDDRQEQRWVGRFECDQICDRPFDCGTHHCSLKCHVPSPIPGHCPRSPDIVQTCPCGNHSLDPSSAAFFPPNATLLRSACTDPIPTCKSKCEKPLPGCSHSCASNCHVGPCPACSVTLVRPCRCSSTTSKVPCYEDHARSRGELPEILCDKTCSALRACGRHQCNRVCCPLASLASTSKGKGKKRATANADNDGIVDDAGWHTCDLICGKPLTCGNHTCEERDHRGPCPSCLRSSFEEMICYCGQTVLEPPIPCGTRINCRFPCSRLPLQCGHPKTQHACHEDPTPCPPCPFLTEKQCACGKKMVPNVRCSQEKVSCGTACGKLLSCGFHHCERLCHSDDCGSCHAVCGKSRKLCMPANHPCTLPCHAPSACSEVEPCRATIALSCPCGRIRQPVPCGRSTSNPAGREGSQQLKCTNECLVVKRNARLAEALGINTEAKAAQVAYSDELAAFAKVNFKFCQLVEKTFSDFVSSEKKSQILPQMPESRRNFVHNLASIYRIDTQMVDQEPHRSVQLIRRLDTRVPAPLLSSVVGTSVAPASLGRLTPLRAPVAQRPVPGPSRATTHGGSSSLTPGMRGWTAIVANPPSSRVSPAPSPTAWLTDNNQTATSKSAPTNVVKAPAADVTVAGPAADVPDDWEDDV